MLEFTCSSSKDQRYFLLKISCCTTIYQLLVHVSSSKLLFTENVLKKFGHANINRLIQCFFLIDVICFYWLFTIDMTINGFDCKRSYNF